MVSFFFFARVLAQQRLTTSVVPAAKGREDELQAADGRYGGPRGELHVGLQDGGSQWREEIR